MKKLLLVSIVMIGASSFASAQNGEALRAKKQTARKEANQPVISNAANEVAKPATTTAVKTDAEVAKKTESVKPAETLVPKASKQAAKKN